MALTVIDRGGAHRFSLEQKVTWQGSEAVILAQTVEPSCTIEFADGRRLTVGQSTLRALEVKTDDDQPELARSPH